MRVYKFLSCKYGLKAIRERRLKISEVHALNDPFDLLPFDLSDPELRKGVVATRNEIGKDRGLLCFSRYWHNPVLWAHYADSHKGLCLGFDLPDGEREIGRAVDYVEDTIKLTYLNVEIANRMLFTKYEHWRYEDEIRVWANLEKKSGDYFFHDFGDDLELKEVIVGGGSPVSKRKILQALGALQSSVRILKARPAFDAFRMVEDEDGLAGG